MHKSNYQISRQSGFTLIEMIVSLGLFAIVVTTSVGALLSLISANQRLQGEQGVMTNLAFALDSMTRELRTGYNYYCVFSANDNGPSNIFNQSVDPETVIGIENNSDCTVRRAPGFRFVGVSFVEGGNSITTGSNPKRILYYYDENLKTIFRRVGDSARQSIVSSGIEIEDFDLRVTGTNKLNPGLNTNQPTVTISIVAREVGDASNRDYRLQTTVTQRVLDL